MAKTMKTGDLFRNLSCEPFWGAQREAVRWAACRYYAEVDNLAQLRALADPQAIGVDEMGGDKTLPAVLTPAEVEMIVNMR